MFTKLQKSELSNRERTLNSLHPQIGFGLKEISDDGDVTKLNRTLKPFFCSAREPAFWLDVQPFPLKSLSPIPGFARSQTRTTLASDLAHLSLVRHTPKPARGVRGKVVVWLFWSSQHQHVPKLTCTPGSLLSQEKGSAMSGKQLFLKHLTQTYEKNKVSPSSNIYKTLL